MQRLWPIALAAWIIVAAALVASSAAHSSAAQQPQPPPRQGPHPQHAHPSRRLYLHSHPRVDAASDTLIRIASHAQPQPTLFAVRTGEAAAALAVKPQLVPILQPPRILAAIPTSISPPARPGRMVAPSSSLASRFFTPSDPFNKGGLMRVRGIGYQPTPVGSSPLAPDAPDLYSQSFKHIQSRDLRLLQRMHANAIRIWSFGGENESGEQVSHLHFLDDCWAHGLFVILTFNPGQGSPKGTFRIPRQPPLNSPAGVEGHESEWARVMTRWRRFVRRYQDHPAVLMWLVGNEPNLHSSTAGTLPDYFRMMDRMAVIRDEECANSPFNGNSTMPSASSNARAAAAASLASELSAASPSPYASTSNRTFSCWHPLSVPMSDTGVTSAQDLLNLLLPLETHWPRAVDIWSFQVYRGNSFGSFFQQYGTFQSKARTRKPLLISEFGSDALDFRMDARGEVAVNQSMQAASVMAQWAELEACPSRVCVGGLVFEYLDEWWKSSQYTAPASQGCPLNESESVRIHASCGWAGRTDDEFYSEAYFGIMAYPKQSDSNDMQCIVPRQAFFELMAEWGAHATAAGPEVGSRTKRTQQVASSRALQLAYSSPELLSRAVDAFCADQVCCAYKDSSSWLSFGIAMGLLALTVAAYWISAARRSRRDARARAEYEGEEAKALLEKRGPPAVVSPSVAATSLAHLQLRALLTTVFDQASLALANTAFAILTPSAREAHQSLQLETLILLVEQQLPRRGGSLPKALIGVYFKLFASYSAWLHFVGLESCLPTARVDLQALAEFLLIWSSCEQLRRVPEFINERFHFRAVAVADAAGAADQFDITRFSHRSSARFSKDAVGLTQKAIDSYAIDYDDLQDLCLQVQPATGGEASSRLDSFARLKLFLSRLWSPRLLPFAYPTSVSWLSVIVQLYSLLTLHLLLFFLVCDVISSSVIVELGGEISLRAFVVYFAEVGGGQSRGTDGQAPSALSKRISASGLATMIKLAQIDALLILLFQVLRCWLTYSAPRLKQILLLLVSLVSLHVLQFRTPLDSVLGAISIPNISVAGLFDTQVVNQGADETNAAVAASGMPAASFALLYLTLRFALLVFQTFSSLFRTTRTAASDPLDSTLPGCVSLEADAQFMRWMHRGEGPDQVKSEAHALAVDQELLGVIDGLTHVDANVLGTFRKAVPSSSAPSAPAAAPAPAALSPFKRTNFRARLGASLWRAARLLMFWVLVLEVKVLFDTFVLLPSVAGISTQSLCNTPFAHGRNLANPWIASTVPLAVKSREELAEESVRTKPNLVGSEAGDLSSFFITTVACPSLVSFLWGITFVISCATTYTSYVLVMAVVGAVVPSFFADSQRWNRGVVGAALGALWFAVVASLALGSFSSCIALILLLALANALASQAGGAEHAATLGRHSSGLDDVRREVMRRGNKALEKQKQQAGSAAASSSSSAVKQPSAFLSLPSAPAAVPAVFGLQQLLQVLFNAPLDISQTLLTWSAITSALRDEDVISTRELITTLNPLSADFLGPLAPLHSPDVRERLHFFFRTLTELRRKSAAQRPKADPHYPFQLADQKRLSTLVPLYNETVFFTIDELVQPSKPAAAPPNASPARHISLLEFLVAKQPAQWTNMIERITHAQPSVAAFLDSRGRANRALGSSMGGLDEADLSPQARTALDELLRSDPSPVRARLEQAAILWCSYRGQTLSRTVRGLLYTRRAFELFTRFELQSQRAELSGNDRVVDDALVRDQFQLVIAAQIYGLRVGGRTNRAHIQQLMRIHAAHAPFAGLPHSASSSSVSCPSPALDADKPDASAAPAAPSDALSSSFEIVYNFEARKDLEECVKLRQTMLGRAMGVETAVGGVEGLRKLRREIDEPLGPFQHEPAAPISAGNPQPISAATGQQLLSSLASLQIRVAACLAQLSSLRMLLRSAVAPPAVPAVAPADAALKPSVSLAHPALKDDVALAIAMVAAASSSSSAVASAVLPQDGVAVHAAMHTCWLEVLRFLRYDASAQASSLAHSAELHQLFAAFLRCLHGCFDDLRELDELTIAAAAPSVAPASDACLELDSMASLQKAVGELQQRVRASSFNFPAPRADAVPVVAAVSAALSDLLHPLLNHHRLQMEAHLAFIAQRVSVSKPTATASSLVSQLPPLLAALFGSFDALIVAGFYSVHACLSTASDSVCVLHAIPRQRNLLLGSVGVAGVPSPQTSAKSENQLHALLFTRGEVVQTVDMNQDFALEEALKLRWLLSEFQTEPMSDQSRFTLVGAAERIFTSDISRVGAFMAAQDTSFVTIVQRVLDYTMARMHYGHPDFMLSSHVKWSSCGLSKASPEKNLSEDLFFGTDNRLRSQSTSHIEYVRWGKGREVSLPTCSIFEDKLARGASQLLRTPDLWRLGLHLDVLSSMSILFGSILHYLYTLLFDYSITSFVWIMVLMRLSGVDAERIGVLGSVYAIPWLFHLGYLFGLPLLAQLCYTHGIVIGVWKFADNVVLGSVYYIFQSRTKSTGMQSGFRGGSSAYKGTGRTFGLVSDTLLTLYQQYARTHYHHALQLLSLLFLYAALFSDGESKSMVLLKCYAVLLACFSWLASPALFNPSFCMDSGTTDHAARVWSDKKLEFRQLLAWIHAPFSATNADGTSASFEAWMWSDRFATLQLRAARSFMYSGRSRAARWAQSPLCAWLYELLMRLVEWLPWLFLAVALLLSSWSLLPAFALYCFLLLLLHLSPLPRALRLAVLSTAILLYFTATQLMDVNDELTMRHRNHSAFLLPLSALPGLFSLGLSFFVLHVIGCDLFLYSAIDWHVGRTLSREYAAAKERGGSEANYTYSARSRPALYASLCSHWCFFSWQLLYRYACPMLVGALHLLVVGATCRWSRWHTRALYAVDVKQLGQQQSRREACVEQPTTGLQGSSSSSSISSSHHSSSSGPSKAKKRSPSSSKHRSKRG